MPMKLLGGLRSRLSGQTQEAFGLGERHPLTKLMIKTIKYHMPSLAQADLSRYSFERRHSDYQGAKSDLVIYDASEQAVLNGREVSDGSMNFWAR